MIKSKNKYVVIAIVLLSVIAYLVLSYDNVHHYDENNYVERALYGLSKTASQDWLINDRVFGFFCNRILHLYIIRGLVNLCNGSIFYMNLFFALLVVLSSMLVCIIVMILPQSSKRMALEIALIALFLPFSLYAGYKALSENSSMLFSYLSIAIFLLSLKATSLRKVCLAVTGGILLFAASMCRSEVIIYYLFAFIISLLVSSLYHPRNILISLFMLIVAYVVLNVFHILITGSHIFTTIMVLQHYPKIVSSLFYNLTELFLFGGILYIFFMLSFCKFREKLWRFSLYYYIMGSIIPLSKPLIWEVRHYYFLTLPFAIICWYGYSTMTSWFIRKRLIYRQIPLMFIIGALLANNIILGDFGVGVKGNLLDPLLDSVSELHGEGIVLVDSEANIWAYVRYKYPSITVQVTKANKYENRVLLPGDRTGGYGPLEDQIRQKQVFYIREKLGRDTLFYRWLLKVVKPHKFRKYQIDLSTRLGDMGRWILDSPVFNTQTITENEMYVMYRVILSNIH